MIYIKVIYDLKYSVIWKYREKNSLEFLWNSWVPSIYLNKDSWLLLHERVLVSSAIALRDCRNCRGLFLFTNYVGFWAQHSWLYWNIQNTNSYCISIHGFKFSNQNQFNLVLRQIHVSYKHKETCYQNCECKNILRTYRKCKEMKRV